MATDIAEVIGGAIALNPLFGLPLVVGVFLTIFDVFLLLFLMKLGFEKSSHRDDLNIGDSACFCFTK